MKSQSTEFQNSTEIEKSEKIFIISHTHWDREWYLTFEEYRGKLIELFDQLLSIFESNEKFNQFLLDGQFVMIEDYLKVRPNKETKILELIRKKYLEIGPFYTSIDEFLISGESIIRNLLIAKKKAKRFDIPLMQVAYLPDTYGHISQLPQILQGFDIKAVVGARGFNQQFDAERLGQEFIWKSHYEQSKILGIHLTECYDNARLLNDTINEKGLHEKAINRLDDLYKKISPFSKSNIHLFLNGGDHLFPQKFLPEIINEWNRQLISEKIDKPEMIQAPIENYIDEIIFKNKKMPELLGDYHGELRYGKFRYILTEVDSARIDTKITNFKIEQKLLRYSEPLNAFAQIYCKDYECNSNYLEEAWCELLKNHAHDTIYGCSIDDLYIHEVPSRFRHAEQIAEEVIKLSTSNIIQELHLDNLQGDRIPILVFNPSAFPRTDVVKIKIRIPNEFKDYFPLNAFRITDNHERLLKMTFKESDYEEISARYFEPNQEFHTITFIANDVPSFGIKVLYLYPDGEDLQDDNESTLDESEQNSEIKELNFGSKFIENKYFHIEIQENGLFDVYDKISKHWYRNQGEIIDQGDWGDISNYSRAPIKNSEEIFSSSKFSQLIKVSGDDTLALITTKTVMQIPESLSDNRDKRSSNFIDLPITIKISLFPNNPIIKIAIQIKNIARDHRIRIHFPIKSLNDEIWVKKTFGILKHQNKSTNPIDYSNWIQPPAATRNQKEFISLGNEDQFLTIINRGLPEYEIMESNNVAITLLRSVGWMSRNDLKSRIGSADPMLSTPLAQMQGEFHFELGLCSGKLDNQRTHSLNCAERFTHELLEIVPDVITSQWRFRNIIPLDKINNLRNKIDYEKSKQKQKKELSLFQLKGDGLELSSIKLAELNSNQLILRITNILDNEIIGTLHFNKEIKNADLIKLNEEQDARETKLKNNFQIDAKKHSIEFGIYPGQILSIAVELSD